MSDDDEMRWHDVAVVVVLRAPGVDVTDAEDRAELAVRRAVRECSTETGGLVNRSGVVMPVVAVKEVGRAAGNGYLWLRPTAKAARDRGFGG